jgi:hypothetical protein
MRHLQVYFAIVELILLYLINKTAMFAGQFPILFYTPVFTPLKQQRHFQYLFPGAIYSVYVDLGLQQFRLIWYAVRTLFFYSVSGSFHIFAWAIGWF